MPSFISRGHFRFLAILLLAAGQAAAQTDTDGRPPLEESLATEAAAKGESDSANRSHVAAVEVALDRDKIVDQLKLAGHWSRTQIAQTVDNRLTVVRSAVRRISAQLEDLPEADRPDLVAQLDQVGLSELEVESAARAVRRADDGAPWTAARDALVLAYEKYAAAVLVAATRADAAMARATPKG